MNLLLLLAVLSLTAAGCQQQGTPRQYTEEVSQVPDAKSVSLGGERKAPDNPHAGIDMGAVTPQARAALEKMLAEGQDPHAGIDMSGFNGKDPHAGLDMPAMTGGEPNGAPNPYSWTLPKGWKQGASKGPMRLASFYLDGDPDAIDCYIVSLPGAAGGLEANLKRWMGQVGIEASDANYQRLLDSSQTVHTQGDLEAKVYDMTVLQKAPAEKSMIAAIISTNDSTVFVKMTGSSGHVQQNRDAFLAFIKTLVPLIKN